MTFFVYPDGIAKHTYTIHGNVKYDVIALYPKDMFDDVTKLVNKYKKLSSTNLSFSIAVVDSLSIRESSFAYEYGLKKR